MTNLENDSDKHSLAWRRKLARYGKADDVRGFYELAATILPFVGLWIAMLHLAQISIWLPLTLTIPAAGFLVRLFMIQHDCGHQAFFSSRALNNALGRAIGAFTLTPYDFWRQSHALHHAGSGNLDRRGIGDIDTITVREYATRTPLQRWAYRLYRHPLVMFCFGPIYLFILQHRLPVGAMDRTMPWISTQLTNVAIVGLAAVLIGAVGLKTFLVIHVPIVIIAASIGVWLFYIQHQFEQTSWERESNWSHPVAALHGSSYYDLPQPLMWFTGNIGCHHVHHLSSRIPFYRLPNVLKDHPELKSIGRLTLLQSFKCVRLTLWDEEKKRLVSFAEASA